MGQALTGNIRDIERFKKEYLEFLATFDRLTDCLEWLIPQTPGWYMPRLEGTPEKPRDVEDVKHLIEHGNLSKRGWEGYHLSNATKAIWRALDIFDELDESDEETLGEGFLDDLHTYLTPIEQIADGDYFVN